MKTLPAVQIENPHRAIFLPVEIGIETYERLAPQITLLRLQSSEPICVFIHCFGGVPSVAEQILRLIRAPRQDGKRCMVTTVCIDVAGSAAADFLSAGDYAIAYGDALIHCHGTREKHSELTVDNIPQVEAGLRQENEYFALKLASRMFRRFATQALLLEVFKTNPPSPNVIAVGAHPGHILGRIAQNVAPEHSKLVTDAIERAERIRKLFEYVTTSKVTDPQAEPIIADRDLLKMIVDFEAGALQDRKKAGEVGIVGMTTGDIALIQEDFINLKELLSGSYHKQAAELCYQKGHYFLTCDEVKELTKIPKTEIEARNKFLGEKAGPKIFPLWYLVVSLCRLLQRGENAFTAEDAWHFGLIDEVAGSNLPSLRKWNELKMKQAATASPSVSGPPNGQSGHASSQKAPAPAPSHPSDHQAAPKPPQQGS